MNNAVKNTERSYAIFPSDRGPIRNFLVSVIFVTLFSFLTTPSQSQIVINELGIAPPSNNSGQGSEFIELYNKGGCSVPIGCYVLVFSSTSGGLNTGWTITIPANTTLAAGAYYLIGGGGGSGAFFSSTWKNVAGPGSSWINLYGTNGSNSPNLDVSTSSNTAKYNTPGLLTDAGGQVTLLNSSGNVVTSVSYNSGNNSSSYSGSFSKAPTGCAALNPISDPTASSNNINYYNGITGAIIPYNTYVQGIYLDAAGTYQYTFSNQTPGKANPSQLTNAAPPTITVTPDVGICIGSSTPLTASGAVSYTWSPSAGLSSTTGTTVTASPTTTTTYTVTGTDANGCTNTAQVTVTVNPKPSPIIYHN